MRLEANSAAAGFTTIQELNKVENSHLEQLETRIRTRLKLLDDEGKKVFGVSAQCNPARPPDWYDQDKFLHAQKLHRTFGAL